MQLVKLSVDFLFRCLPERLLRRMGFKCLRWSSGEFRAFTELFIPPYEACAEWKSGLGTGVYVLYALVRTLVPDVVVEIGSARGKSTCALALACRHNRHGKVYAIDPHTVNGWSDWGTEGDTEQFLRNRLRDYGLEDWCEVIRATSAVAAKHWSKPIDLLFIDGDHSFDGVRHDFEAFRPYLTNHALVLFHDTTWEHHREHPAYREGIGVPRYMHELKQAGYQSITARGVPGLTILDSRPGGFAFLSAGIPKQAVDGGKSLGAAHAGE